MQQEGGEVERPSFLLNGDSGPYANRSEHAHRPDQRRKDEVARIVELQRQLKYAGSVRANYEQQLHQLSQALQNERERKGEDSLKLHQLFEELQELRNHKDVSCGSTHGPAQNHRAISGTLAYRDIES